MGRFDRPTAQLDHHRSRRYRRGHILRMARQDLNLIAGQVVFLQIGDLEPKSATSRRDTLQGCAHIFKKLQALLVIQQECRELPWSMCGVEQGQHILL